MKKSTWTFACSTCGKKRTLTCYGTFAPMAERLAQWPILFHVLFRHKEKRRKTLIKMAIEIPCLFLSLLFCVLHTVSYVLYPIYFILDVIFG